MTLAKIAADAVGTTQIANSSVTVDKLNVASATLTVDTLVANTITGTADIASQVALTGDNSSNATKYITFADSPTGNQGLKTDTGLFYNPASNVLTTTATQAQYADLAERYTSDKKYEVGTIMCIGGHAETTICVEDHCSKAIGVVSEKPAFIMNGSLEGMSVAVALTGRVPVRICGPVRKGDLIVSCEKTGCGRREAEPRPGALIGKSLVNDDSTGERLVEIVVGTNTSKKTIDSIKALTKKINKSPLLVMDSPGFVSNRILLPMINEAIETLSQGVEDVYRIDQIMKKGMGHPMGPVSYTHLTLPTKA